jgi:hypothetical protein
VTFRPSFGRALLDVSYKRTIALREFKQRGEATMRWSESRPMSMHPRVSEPGVDLPNAEISEPRGKARRGNVWPVAALVTGGVLTLAWVGLIGWLLFAAFHVTFL